ncbi:hypothetical protein AMATHDRAFT_1051 [Amanita thiersii Skay4041]|uniref:Methyltransferase domain-containing protein n=1 Tax=Amanita thiersii Skay4041 TaxID=703135 RepID=A0A2A9NS53_9AGAR|nr:hypothetical protein AMATHDRAFT_1051 [Amanita thiersii Skay4041]
MSLSVLTASLAARIGHANARQEIIWLSNSLLSSPSSDASLASLIKRRLADEPLQYILGTQPFGPLNLLSRPPVLIPRPETEHWVINLSEYTRPSPLSPRRLLDLGTGSGCIPLLLCHLWPDASLRTIGLDISDHAIQLANDNAALCGTSGNSFKTVKASILDPGLSNNTELQPPFDIITSNPPYITWQDYLKLPRSVFAFEDPRALFGGPNGLDFYHAIARFISGQGILNSDAVVALEVGDGQAKNVERLIQQIGCIRHTEIWKDPWGKERTVIARTGR